MTKTLMDEVVEELVGMMRTEILRTSEQKVADESPFQYAVARDGKPGFTTSPLGIINGFLPKLPGQPVLVVHVESGTEKPVSPYFSVRSRWWPK